MRRWHFRKVYKYVLCLVVNVLGCPNPCSTHSIQASYIFGGPTEDSQEGKAHFRYIAAQHAHISAQHTHPSTLILPPHLPIILLRDFPTHLSPLRLFNSPSHRPIASSPHRLFSSSPPDSPPTGLISHPPGSPTNSPTFYHHLPSRLQSLTHSQHARNTRLPLS